MGPVREGLTEGRRSSQRHGHRFGGGFLGERPRLELVGLEDLRSHAAGELQNGDQDMLGFNGAMTEAVGSVRSENEDSFAFGRERHFDGSANGFATGDAALDFGANSRFNEGHVGMAWEPVLVGMLAQEAEKKVLGFDGWTAVIGGIIASEEDRATSGFGEAFEHGGRI